MNRNSFWRWALVALLVAWALYELYPPMGRNLVGVFQANAVRTDATFNDIVAEAEALGEENPQNAFGNLMVAVGTNDIRTYFPQFETSAQLQPTTYILNRLQRRAAGQIQLGLDLQAICW